MPTRRLVDSEIVEIRSRLASGEAQKNIVAAYGLSTSYVSRLARGHRRTAASDREARFWENVLIGDVCWTWTAHRNASGYGSLRWHGRETGAHVVSFLLNVEPDTKGLHVLHRCDNRPCVRPSHLFLGTNADNVADRVAKGRSVGLRGDAAPWSKLSSESVRIIRWETSRGATRASLARRFSVSEGAVLAVIQGRTWGHLQ